LEWDLIDETPRTTAILGGGQTRSGVSLSHVEERCEDMYIVPWVQ